ncbi:MAG: helix-turn-helix transcriptional regulator [Parasporobacterium sp.]|nr:helix-turn-helix transcriptional regulator [Parasporobacterium sp.]
MRDIGKNIKEFRIRNHYSQEEMAEKLYVTRQTVSNYETGRSRPDVDTLIRIAEIYGVGVNNLIYGEKEMTRKDLIHRVIRIGICVFLIIVMGAFLYWFNGYSRVITSETLNSTWRALFLYVLRPLMSAAIGVLIMIAVAQNVKIRSLKKNTVERKATFTGLLIVLAFSVVLLLAAVINLLEIFGVDMRWIGPGLYIGIIPAMANIFFFENWYGFIMIGLTGELIRRWLKKPEN